MKTLRYKKRDVSRGVIANSFVLIVSFQVGYGRECRGGALKKYQWGKEVIKVKKALSCSLAFFLIAMSALVIIPANAGLGGSTYRVFYTHEDLVGDKNGDGETDYVVALYDNSAGTYEYVGIGVEPEISGELVMWHSEDYTNLYIFHAQYSPNWLPYEFRDYYQDAELAGDGIAFNSFEYMIGELVNQDPDMNDDIVGYMNLNGFPVLPPDPVYWTGYKTPRGGYDGYTVTYVKIEAQENWPNPNLGHDYNGDWDYDDTMIHYRAIEYYAPGPELHPGHPPNLVHPCHPDYIHGQYPRVGGDAIVWTTWENEDNCDWDDLFPDGMNDYLVVAFRIPVPTVYLVFDHGANSNYVGIHYADNSLIAFGRVAYDGILGSETYYYELGDILPTPVFLGIPIKVTHPFIEGYLKESEVGVDLNGDGPPLDDQAMWIFDRSTGRLEILEGGNTYWK